MIFLGTILILAWILIFTIIGCKRAKSGNIWGLLLATIGLGFLGFVIAYCHYETWKISKKNKQDLLNNLAIKREIKENNQGI
ncbi:hypothetical protein [Spiroplasma endosymbiont of Cantharis rufa]|uniref:hypothetical protein n=1 Tax=Spiroplasma endosymbiont of Cantharis rufa TaxID=3066279 RepID=UPI0030CB2F34